MAIILYSTMAHSSEPLWIDLFPPDAMEGIDSNVNIINACGSLEENEKKVCLGKSSPKTPEWRFNLYEEPSSESKKVGEFVISLGLDEQNAIYASYVKDKKSDKVKIQVDDYDPYGGGRPYFDFTILQVKNNWVQLPKNPFDNPVWLKIPDYAKGTERVRKLELKEFYRLSGKYVIKPLKIKKDSLVYRKFNGNDMDCGNPPVKVPKEDLVEKEIPFRDLYDRDGRLTIKIAFTKGC